VEILERMGVLEPTRSELAGLEWATPAYLEGWERWLWDQGGETRVGVVVANVRLGVRAPASKGRRRRQRYAEQFAKARVGD